MLCMCEFGIMRLQYRLHYHLEIDISYSFKVKRNFIINGKYNFLHFKKVI